MPSTTALPNFDKTEPTHPKYILDTHLSARVGNLNSAWNDPKPDTEAQFKKAMQMAGEEFLTLLRIQVDVWLPARELVLQGVNERHAVDAEGRIIVLPQGCPWKQHLFAIEEEQGIVGQLKYAIFEDQSKSWRVQSIPINGEAFQNRAPLPESWRGKREAALDAELGISGCVFCHHSGFIGGHQTKEGVLQMAFKALALLNR